MTYSAKQLRKLSLGGLETHNQQSLRSVVQDGFAQMKRGGFSNRSMDKLFYQAKIRVVIRELS